MIQTRFPAKPLFVLRAVGMASRSVSFEGPLGRRSVFVPTAGGFEGERLRGSLVAGQASETRIEPAIGGGETFIDGLITLRTEAGHVVMMNYLGRRSRSPETPARLGIAFEADIEETDWLNDVVAVADVVTDGDDLIFTVSELLGRDVAADEHALPVKPLYTIAAASAVGQRLKMHGQYSDRYFTVSEGGCKIDGRLQGTWSPGFARGPHRTARDGGVPMYIDRQVAIVTRSRSTVLKHCLGTTPRSLLSAEPGADRSWKMIAVFEAPVDPDLAWLNNVVAVGVGWADGEQVLYEYFELDG